MQMHLSQRFFIAAACKTYSNPCNYPQSRVAIVAYAPIITRCNKRGFPPRHPLLTLRAWLFNCRWTATTTCATSCWWWSVSRWACTPPCMPVHMYVCLYVCMYACLSVRMYVCMYVCMSVCLYVYMHACVGRLTTSAFKRMLYHAKHISVTTGAGSTSHIPFAPAPRPRGATAVFSGRGWPHDARIPIARGAVWVWGMKVKKDCVSY